MLGNGAEGDWIPHPEGHSFGKTYTNQYQHTFCHHFLGDDEAWIHQGGQLPLVMGNLHHASRLCLKTEVLHCKLGYFVILHGA